MKSYKRRLSLHLILIFLGVIQLVGCGYYIKLTELNWFVYKNPDDRQALFNRATLRSELGNDKGAISDLKRIIELYPDDANAYGKLGGIYLRLEDKENALENYHKAERIICSRDQDNRSCESIQMEIEFVHRYLP